MLLPGHSGDILNKTKSEKKEKMQDKSRGRYSGVLENADSTLKRLDHDDSAASGDYVAAKLHKLSPIQHLYATSEIMRVLAGVELQVDFQIQIQVPAGSEM